MKKPGIWILVTLVCVPVVSFVSWQIEGAHAHQIKSLKDEINQADGLYRGIAKLPATDWPRVQGNDRLKMAMAGASKVAERAKILIDRIEPLRNAGRRLLGEIDEQMADPANATQTFHTIITRIVKAREAELQNVLTEKPPD